MGRATSFPSSDTRPASCDSGMWIAVGSRPPSNSFGSRTSSSTALRRLRSCVASALLTSFTDENRRCTKGQTSIAPDIRNTEISIQLFCTNDMASPMQSETKVK